MRVSQKDSKRSYTLVQRLFKVYQRSILLLKKGLSKVKIETKPDKMKLNKQRASNKGALHAIQ
jgi:hypothetical protein